MGIERFKKIEVMSAGTGNDLLNIPDAKVFELSTSQTRGMEAIVFDWIQKRPLLNSGIWIGAVEIERIREKIQLLTPLQREREFISLAQNEAVEFVTSVREKQSSNKIQLELGDTLFSLLASSEAVLLYGANFDSIDDYTKAPFKKVIPKILRTVKSCTAEECLLLSVSLINQLSGSVDASKLEDINNILCDSDDTEDRTLYDNLLNEDPILNSFDLTFDLAFRYTALMDWDLLKIIKQTAKKNDGTMPAEFFGSFAPFTSVSDILSCLRLFRKYVFTTQKGSFKTQFNDKYWSMLRGGSIHPLGYEFRLWTAGLLDEVKNNNDINIMDRSLAGELQKRNIVDEHPLWGSKHAFQITSINL